MNKILEVQCIFTECDLTIGKRYRSAGPDHFIDDAGDERFLTGFNDVLRPFLEITKSTCEGLMCFEKHCITCYPTGSEDTTSSTSPLSTQEGGDHYKSREIQPIEYIHANQLGFCEGNVVKYITRWREKNGREDLEKVKHYVDLLIELEKL